MQINYTNRRRFFFPVEKDDNKKFIWIYIFQGDTCAASFSQLTKAFIKRTIVICTFDSKPHSGLLQG